MLPWWLSDIRGAFLALALLTGVKRSSLVRSSCIVTSAHVALLSSCSVGLLFSLSFYVHTTRTVFNRKPTWYWKSFWDHLVMTRPLEAAWRFMTFPLRATPDFLILGEVRTGTTSLAASLRELGCRGPFSPWIVPLASDKESFYFSGHYFGFMHPAAYRMCFPLRITVWFHRRVLGQPYPVFDACASYLTAPWVAPLLKAAVSPDAVFLALLREPVSQNVSWWKLEMGAHLWARSMGMSQAFLDASYPPKDFQEALERSRSAEVQALYEEGERRGMQLGATRSPLTQLKLSRFPERLLPFPGGQLLALDRMGRYADNLERLFSCVGKDRVLCFDSSDLTARGLEAALEQLAALVPDVKRLLDDRCSASGSGGTFQMPRLNASSALPSNLEPSTAELDALRAYYESHNRRLFELVGRDLGWNDGKGSLEERR